MGHVEAQEMVAMEYLRGKYLRLNLTGALDLFQTLKDKAHPTGQMVRIGIDDLAKECVKSGRQTVKTHKGSS